MTQNQNQMEIKGNMSLDKAIEHGKEKRKPYIGAKSIAYSCRNHGSCKWCENNRKHKFRDKHPLDIELLETLNENQ